MQDAVLFCVMVSIAGAILMPAFTSTIPQETHVQKEQQEKADEVLHQLMVCRVNKSAHLNAEPALEELGNTVNVDLTQGLIGSVIDGLLKREQRHLTYADLCTESVACQFNVLGTRVNVLTQNFTDVITREVGMFLHNQFGDEYLYNFTVKWHPIVGFDFGGNIAVGPVLPANTDISTATTYATMPPSLFTTEPGFKIESFRHYIESTIETRFHEYRDGTISEEEFSTFLEGALLDLINKTIWGGFDFDQDGTFNEPFDMKSIVDMVLDYIFGEIQDNIQQAFEEALSMVTGIIGEGISQDIGFDSLCYRALRTSLASLSDTIGVDETIGEMVKNVKEYLKTEARHFVNKTFGEKIHSMVHDIVNNLEGVTEIGTEILNWVFQHINFCRAKLSLSIWEA